MNRKPFLLLTIIFFGYSIGYYSLDRWQTTLLFGDSNGYYLHLVSFFINQDVGDYDKTITALRKVSPQTADPREDKYGIRLTPKGKRYIKYTLGVPIMESPFFLIAHAYTQLSGNIPADGWSEPYRLIVSFSVVFYVLIGFFLLHAVLRNFFSEYISHLSILTIAFATNLFFQATYVTMAHGFLFFDYCLLIFCSYWFYQDPKNWKALLIGGIVGLITITRIPEIISFIIPLFWGVSNWKNLRERLRFLLDNKWLLISAGFGFLLIFSIQVSYWYFVSGRFIFNPYEGEGFNFFQPNIWKGFFHFKNGWLIYTPVMAFSLIGLLGLGKHCKAILLPTGLFLVLHIYIHYSYYAWSYFPGLGQRPMVETYPLLAFGLAAFFQNCKTAKVWSWIPIPLILGFSILNLFQTWQMKEGLIWPERGNPAFYYETFGQTKSSKDALVTFDAVEIQPDSQDLNFVAILLEESFEDSINSAYVSNIRNSGRFSFLTGSETFTNISTPVKLKNEHSPTWIQVSVDGFVDFNDQTWERDKCLRFGLQFIDQQGKIQKEKTIKLSPHLGNPDFSIWSTGEAGQWDRASFWVRSPKSNEEELTLQAILKNPFQQKLYLDNLKLEVFNKKRK